LIIAILLGGGYIGVNLYLDSFLDKTEEGEVIDGNEVINEEVIISKEADEVVNFLIVGADNLQNDIGRENSFVEERSDVMKVISLDYTTKKIKITSLDRDVVEYFPLEGYEDYYRFNWAYSWGKSKLCIATINYNLDLDITKYVSTSFAGFIAIIDEIGGVDIELTKAEADAFNGDGNSNAIMNIEAKEGINHLDGYDALAYARQRYVDSDYNRMQRQTNVIKKVVEKVKGLGYKDLLSLVNTLLPYVSTNLTNDEIKEYLVDVLSFDLNNIETTSYPEKVNEDYVYWNYNSDMGGYILKDYESEVIRLHKYIYEVEDYEVSNSLKQSIKNCYKIYPYVKEGKPSGV